MGNNDSALKIKASFKFHLTCFGAALMHMTFLVTFVCMELYMMAVMNVVSVSLYVIGGIYSLRKDITSHALGWIIATFAEITLHAVICTVIQGVEVFFFLYPLVAMPLYAYYLFVYCTRSTYIKAAVGFGMITLIVLTLTITFVESYGTIYTVTGMHELTDGEIRVLRSINVLFTMGIVLAFVLIFYLEVSHLLGELQKTNIQLNYTATHDSLTGLNNRHSIWPFFEELEKSGENYCIVMGDLDDFKKINDTYGHDCGDLVLKSVSNIIIENTHDDEMACRWGGEEILIVMRGSREECFARISIIKSEISSLELISGGRPVKVTMTFGFADSAEEENAVATRTVSENTADSVSDPSHHLGIDSLISMVDKRLYVGKRSGKNVIVSVID